MKRKRQAGQAFILVLIILAIGALVVVPTLRLTTTVLKSSQTITQRNKGLYACEAAQQKIMWMLYNDIDGLVSQALTDDGDTISFTIDVCGTTVYAGITMRAVEMEGGVTLVGEHTIMPTKTVSPSAVPNGDPGPYQYTIAMEQVSSNTTNKLEAVYDILPPAFTKQFDNVYQLDSSETSIDGIEWTPIPDPSHQSYAQQVRLRWPASGNFTDLSFKQFEPGDIHYLRFEVKKPVTINDDVACNWVVLQVGDILTVSGPQAPLVVGPPEDPEGCANDGLFEVWKTSYPEIIPPLQPTTVTYTIHITNMTGSTRKIGNIVDTLPPGFEYISENTSGSIIVDPADWAYDTFNGVERQYIWWQSGPGEQLGASGIGLSAGDNATISFRAVALQGISGSYYNEVIVSPDSMPASYSIFTDLGLTLEDVGSMYSWSSGTVIVPAYDSSTGADGENITASLALDPDSVRIISWHPQ